MSELKRAIRVSALGKAEVSDEGEISRRYSFPPDFAGFAGHFPGHPILPAVVQVLTVLSMLEEHRGVRMKLRGLDKAKFLSILSPGDDILVSCVEGTLSGETVYRARLTVNEEIVAVFNLTCEEEEERE